MSEPRPAYLLVHKIALYNDEWYTDHTEHLIGVNPAGLYATRHEAQAAARAATRASLRGATFDDLELDEDTNLQLARLVARPGDLSPALSAALPDFHARRAALPADLSDTDLDTLIDRTGLSAYHILESHSDTFDLTLAQAVLALTPQRPDVDVCFEHEDDDGRELDPPRQVIEASADPAVQRLNRVTALFGRRYATGIPL